MDFEKIIKGEICPYCSCSTQLVDGELIYPHKLSENPRPKYLDKKYYLCLENKDHYVGTYADNITSLGRLANASLRKLKNEGHNIFDPLWKEKNIFNSQKQAYDWLSEKMELPLAYTHFGMFTEEQCQKAITFCKEIAG